MIHEQKGAAEAESILEDLGFDTLPVSPQRVAEAISDGNFRLELEFQEFESPSILGTAMGNSQAAIIVVNNKIPDDGRSNFTIAHELGHVCLHIMSEESTGFRCGESEIRDTYKDPFERQANGFASGLLMPARLLTQVCETDICWDNIHKVKQACNTSLEASFRRLIALSNEPSALVIHKDGLFKRFVKSESFHYFLQRSPLTSEQLEQRHDGLASSLNFGFEEVDASDWVDEDWKAPLDSIYASSLALKSGFTYTLLTYDEDCFDGGYDE